jgi:hypothetical protein
MATTTAMTTSFKQEILEGVHNFLLSGGSTFKLALIKSAPAGTYGAASTSYTNITGNTDEASGTGYTTGGATLTRIDPTTSGTTAFTDFADVQLTTATITASACMIYNDTDVGDAAVSTHDFAGDKTASGGNFDITMPTADATNAILRIA